LARLAKLLLIQAKVRKLDEATSTTGGNGGNDVAKQAGRDVVPGTIGSRPTELADRDSVNALLERMEAGDKAATTKFVDYLRGDRVLAAAVLERASTAMTHWLDYGTSEPLSRFVMEERAKQLRHSLLGESPTPLERLLVERIVICSVQLQIAEGQYVRVIQGDRVAS
jgi:hypothetical protein